MYSDETVRRIELRYEREIDTLLQQKTRIVAIERVLDTHSEMLQLLDVRETPEGIYIRVR